MFFEKAKKRKKSKTSKNEKNPGPWVSPRGGFLVVGIPPLPDPEWLQAGALAGALDSPCGGTLDFFDFFIFWFFSKNQKNQKINNIFLIFLMFFEKAKKRKKSKTSTKWKKSGNLGLPAWGVSGRGNPSSPGSWVAPGWSPWLSLRGHPGFFLIFFITAINFFGFFSKKPKNEKNQKHQKNPGPWVSPRGGFLAVGIPPLPDPEWLQAGALAGALDSPCGGTLDFFDFFPFLFFWFFSKNQKNQ